MSLSQLHSKQGINYAKLRHKRSSNDYSEGDLKHQRAKSFLETHKKQDEDYEQEALFDNFFKNSSEDQEFIKFLEDSIDYHQRTEIKQIRPANKNLMQQLKEALISNRLLANELNKSKSKEQQYKTTIKLMQKEFENQYSQLVQKCQWLEELLAKQKIDNENSLLAVKKTVEMLSTKCKCKNIQYIKQQLDIPPSSSSVSETQENEDYRYQFFEKRRKSITKPDDNEQLVQSFIHGKQKNPREYQNDYMRNNKRQFFNMMEESNGG
ncbi:hypothetical protein pb186bvf_008771 [Paramecium bursaria]